MKMAVQKEKTHCHWIKSDQNMLSASEGISLCKCANWGLCCVMNVIYEKYVIVEKVIKFKWGQKWF